MNHPNQNTEDALTRHGEERGGGSLCLHGLAMLPNTSCNHNVKAQNRHINHFTLAKTNGAINQTQAWKTVSCLTILGGIF